MPRWICCAILLTLAAAGPADACECAALRSPCQAFGSAPAIFLGQVVKGERQMVGAKASRYFQMDYTFEVLESFRGIDTKSVNVVTGMGGSDCGIRFKIGGTYLIYAISDDASPQSLKTNTCSRTKPAEEASGDLAFLGSLAGKAPNGKITGYFSTKRPNPWEEYDGKGGLPGVTVRLESDHSHRETQTTASGTFEFDDVAPGEYRISAAMPRNLSGGTPRTILLPKQACRVEPFIAKEPGAN